MPPATVSLTPWAQVLGKLQRLHDEAPAAAFKDAVGQMADTVKAAADKASGGAKDELTKLHQKLAEVAKSGDLSVFRPTHHRHHVHAASQGSSSMLQTLLDQIDHVLGPDAASSSSQT